MKTTVQIFDNDHARCGYSLYINSTIFLYINRVTSILSSIYIFRNKTNKRNIKMVKPYIENV